MTSRGSLSKAAGRARRIERSAGTGTVDDIHREAIYALPHLRVLHDEVLVERGAQPVELGARRDDEHARRVGDEDEIAQNPAFCATARP